MTLNQKQWLCAGIMLVGPLLFILAGCAQNAVQILTALGCLCVMGGLLLQLKLIRCPYCDAWIGKGPGEFCKHCGKELPWDEK